MLIGIYLSGGLLNAMVSLLVPRLKLTLGLDFHQALTVQLAYYSSYLLFALPITLMTVRIGYMRAISAGLAVMSTACLFLTVSYSYCQFPAVLGSLLLLSSGVTILQIAGNAVITAAAPSPAAASRFTLLQAFNSLGTVLGPLIGSRFLLSRSGEALTDMIPFLATALGLLVLSIAFFLHRDVLRRPAAIAEPLPSSKRVGQLLASNSMRAGVLAIFLYVGAEVTVGSLAISYLMARETVGVDASTAGRLVSLYWAAAMAGRFGGAYLLRHMPAGRLLALVASGALVLLIPVVGLQGVAGAVAILMIGLCHSVMFPIIYAMALPQEEADVPFAAMLLCMAVVGGAIVPFLTGFVADDFGLAYSFMLPGLCYAAILAFAVYRLPHFREFS